MKMMKCTPVLLIVLSVVFAACGPLATPTPTPTSIPPTSTVSPVIKLNMIPGIENLIIQKGINHEFTGAILIAYQGEVLLNQGTGLADRANEIANTPQTRFRVGTFAQQFATVSLLLLQDQGKLDVQNLICDYLPECPAAWQDVTLHHLLAWRSGIPDYGIEENESDYGVITAEELAAYFMDKPLDSPPGEKWTWFPTPSNILLGYVIEQVSGESYEDFVQNHIFTPLGMVNTGFDLNPSGLALGYPNTFSQEAVELPVWSNSNLSTTLYSTVEDLYLFDRALLSGELISPGLVDLMITPHSATTDVGNVGFGYGWWLPHRTGREAMMALSVMDGYQAYNGLYPHDQIVIIVLGNQGDRSAEELAGFIESMFIVKQ